MRGLSRGRPDRMKKMTTNDCAPVSRRLARFGSLTMSFLAVQTASGQAARPHHGTEWYLLTIAATPVGWMHETRNDRDSAITLASQMRLVLDRLGTKVVMTFDDRTAEGRDGRLLTDEMTMRLSEQAT